MRVRWTHELTARALWELAGRLVSRGVLDEPAAIAELTVAEVTAAVAAGTVPDDLALRRRSSSAPLPAAFRRTGNGRAAALAVASAGATAGTGAGGGRGEGVVAQRRRPAPHGRRARRAHARPGLRVGAARAAAASCPRPAACCRTSPSWPGSSACRPWSAWPDAVERFPPGPSCRGRSHRRGRRDPGGGGMTGRAHRRTLVAVTLAASG